MELLYPLYRLKEEEVEVVVAGLDDTPVTGKKGHGPLDVDTIIEGLAASDFDAVVIPGGYAPDKLRRCLCRPRPGPGFPYRGQADRLHLPRGLGADLGSDLERPSSDEGSRPSAMTRSTPASTGLTRPR